MLHFFSYQLLYQFPCFRAPTPTVCWRHGSLFCGCQCWNVLDWMSRKLMIIIKITTTMTTTTTTIIIITILLQHCNNVTIMSEQIFTLKQSFHINRTEKKKPCGPQQPFSNYSHCLQSAWVVWHFAGTTLHFSDFISDSVDNFSWEHNQQSSRHFLVTESFWPLTVFQLAWKMSLK